MKVYDCPICEEYMATTITYRLPWPPSVNSYWRRGNNVTYLTKKAREFRNEVCHNILNSDEPVDDMLTGRLAVHLELTLPDRRKRDIDNHIKAAVDALEHAGVFEDDEQIDDLRVTRLHVEPPGACDVTIVELSPQQGGE
jgi:crossover junction endodeoxyribonuclease RusA